mmetsp:Transcript_30546/g.51153  ORF Transcript_30546/g.51153 Transcript_30546/m.51153 type:complete len:368 (+) Transcript_30546:337-1440(+)
MACQEGYYPMVQFMTNPQNRSDLDQNELEIEPRNLKNRTPLMLCFTPPCATYCGMTYGLDADGNALSEKPEEIENAADWCKPGGPKNRENIMKLLVDKHGANIHEKDFQDFTLLHYASMWGWTSTVKYLLEKGADINAQTASGRTPLMFAVQYLHLPLVTMLLGRKRKDGAAAVGGDSSSKKAGGGGDLLLEASDLEGYTALILAIEIGEEAMDIARILLREGADPNALTLRRKNPLKIACGAQNVAQVQLLLDYSVQRRNSAFNLLKEEVLEVVNRRLEEDDRKQRAEEEKRAKEQEKLDAMGFYDPSKGMKSPYGAWVEYREKKTGKAFYYNTVTRKSVRLKPKDFKPSKARIVPEAIYGLSFYH